MSVPDEFVCFYKKFTVGRQKKVKASPMYIAAIGCKEEVEAEGKRLSEENDSVILMPRIFKINDTLDSIVLDAHDHFEDLETRFQATQK